MKNGFMISMGGSQRTRTTFTMEGGEPSAETLKRLYDVSVTMKEFGDTGFLKKITAIGYEPPQLMMEVESIEPLQLEASISENMEELRRTAFSMLGIPPYVMGVDLAREK